MVKCDICDKPGDRELFDERILGGGDFVGQIINEAEERIKYRLPKSERLKKVEKLIDEVCKKEKVNVQEIRCGSRRRFISQARSDIPRKLVEDYGVPLAEVARHVGVSTSAISKIMKKELK